MTKAELYEGLNKIVLNMHSLWFEVECLPEVHSSEYERLYEAKEAVFNAIKELEDKLEQRSDL